MLTLAEKNEALDHLRATYSHFLYCEPWSEHNKQRLRATANKFRYYKTLSASVSNNAGKESSPRLKFAVQCMKQFDRKMARKLVAETFELDSHDTTKLLDTAVAKIKRLEAA